MYLKKFDYSEFANKENGWSISGLNFVKFSLLIGKNSAGKTNTIMRIFRLAQFLCGQYAIKSGIYEIEFREGETKFEYSLSISESKVEKESLLVDGKSDLKQKSKIIEWAKKVSIINPRNARSAIELFEKGNKEYAKDFKKKAIEIIGRIGYDIADIGTENDTLYIKEENVKEKIFQEQISQGMFRTLSLIVQITYAIIQKSSIILIDDVGEGVDFDRASNTIDEISALVQKSNIQFVISSNDRYVMNNVPLKCWQIIKRKGGICNAYNYKNSKAIFDEFEFTGLSNFDFLKTDFLETGK